MTPDASARCRASATRPSLTSIMAVAPAMAAAGPAAYGGCGRRWASMTAAGSARPAWSRARPAADSPTRPARASRSPGRAPLRSTGARPCRSPIAVTETVTSGLRTTSPPTRLAPARAASAPRAAEQSAAQSTGRVGGAPRATTRAVGTAPIAATSARLAAAALWPTSMAVLQSRRKCWPSTSMSTVMTTRPSGAATSAVSSPGPRMTPGPSGRSATMRSMRANSPTSPSEGEPCPPVIDQPSPIRQALTSLQICTCRRTS